MCSIYCIIYYHSIYQCFCTQVFGSSGMLQCNNPVTNVVTHMTQPATMTSPAPYSFPQRYEQAYMLELEHFLDLVGDPRKTLKVQKRDTLRATQLAIACETSYKNGLPVSFQYKEY